MENNQPIIVKRVKKSAAGHHGGAWKIAFADFATAMMAFFMLLWLMSSATPEQKRQISGYFQDPIGFTESASPFVIDLGGTPTPAPDRTLNPESQGQPDDDEIRVNPKDETEENPPQTQVPDPTNAESIAEQAEQERLEMLLQELQTKVDENLQLKNFKDQILFEITQDGLRIQIMDAANRPMFSSGSANLQPYFEDILLALAETIKEVPNKISVSGHTDATPFAGGGDFGNWELSANRANAARRALVFGSYPEEQIARVVGYASSALFDREDPFNPVNRRIDITVLTKKAQRAIEGESDSEGDAATPDWLPALPGGDELPTPSAEDPAQAAELRDKLNAFDDGALTLDQPVQE